jgi:hypothetical protein
MSPQHADAGRDGPCSLRQVKTLAAPRATPILESDEPVPRFAGKLNREVTVLTTGHEFIGIWRNGAQRQVARRRPMP